MDAGTCLMVVAVIGLNVLVPKAAEPGKRAQSSYVWPPA